MVVNSKLRLKFDARILSLLKGIGLTDKETQLLLICMQQSKADIDQLVLASGLKRPTVYYVARTLVRKGLVSESRDNGRLAFRAGSVENLQQFTHREAQRIDDYGDEISALSHLFPIDKDSLPKTAVEHFSGTEGVKSAIEKALHCKRREWLIVAPASHRNFFGQFDKQYWDYFMQTREARGIKSRSLWEHETKLLRKVGLRDMIDRKPRYLPKELKGMFSSVMIVYDNRVLFITSLAEKSAVIITSDEMSAMMRAFFEGLWLGSHNILKK